MKKILLGMMAAILVLTMAAGALAEEAGCLTAEGGRIRPDERVTEDEVRQFLSAKVGKAPTQVPGNLTHGDFFLLAAPLL